MHLEHGILFFSVNLVGALITLFLICLTVWFGRFIWYKGRENSLYIEGIAWLDVHRSNLKGDNRFPVGENYFAQAFYDYPPHLVHKVWIRYIAEHQFSHDPLDGQLTLGRRL